MIFFSLFFLDIPSLFRIQQEFRRLPQIRAYTEPPIFEKETITEL